MKIWWVWRLPLTLPHKTFTFAGAAVGEHLIVLQVVDTAGNQGEDSVGISMTAP